MDIQQNGTTYIKLHPSTTYGYARPPSYASSRVSVHKQDANNFYTVAAFYCTKLDSKLKNDMDHYVHIGVKMFGSGGFSNAVGVSETGVAKFPKIAPGSDGFSEKDFYRDLITELRICLHTPVDAHENIIQFHNIQWTAGLNVSNSEKFDFMWPVLEFETAPCTLANLLGSDPTISFSTKINLCLDVAKGLDCLHDCGIVHSDIKSENVLILPHSRHGYIAKISDFGCSSILDDSKTCARLSGYTRLWCAPECDKMMNHEELYRVDQYCFGLMLWQVITDGKSPFDWFSWMDNAPLSLDDITALKNDNCMLPLALDALEDLPLNEREKNICSEIFKGTLDCNELRVDYLSPLFERYWVPFSWGYRELDSWKLGVKQYVESIPPMNIMNVLKDMTLDHRVSMQIFDSIKWYLSYVRDKGDEYGIASTSYQLFLCYYYGYGTDRDIQACMSALAEAARYGSSEAQNLVAQFFDAHGMEVPEDLPICDWLEPRALDYTPGAAKTLEAIDPERYENIISKQRSTTDTSVGLCSFSIGGVENLILKYPHETRSLIEEIDTITRNTAGLNLIHMAAASGHLPVIRSLLENGFCDHEVRDSYGKTALYHACRNGHRDIALLLLSQYSTVDGRPFSDKQELIDTCFHSMISFYSNDMLEVATFLMRLPGSINKSPGDGSVLLQRALMDNNVEAVRILLGYGEQRTYSEILMATSLRCSEILYLFLYDMAEKEGPLDASMLGKLLRFAVTQDTFMSIQLHGYKHTSAVISTVETIEYFIQLWYPQPNLIIETVKCQIFNEASIARRLDTLQLVLDPFFKSYIRLASKMWDSVLLLPLVLGDTGMFDLFLENGAAEYNDNHTFEHGRYRGIPFRTLDNLFSTAIQSSNPFFIRSLLDVGIWLDEDRLHKAAILPDEAKRYCPFQLAVLKTCYDTATFLAKHTKQIETKTISWNVFIAYMIPTQLNLGFTMLDYLINLKAIPTPLPDSDGSTVLHYLSTLYPVDPDSRRSRLRKFWAEIMVRFRDQIDIQTLEGRTALDSAISQHNILMVEALIEAGADLNILNEDGLTALDKLLIARSIAVLRVNPKLPPRIESHIMRRKPLDRKSFLGPVADRGPVLDLDAAMFPIDSKDPLGRDYHGDSFDERLSQIYTMLRNAGGVSVLFPHPLACTERLENWTSMWINIGRESSQQPKGEARDVIDQLVRVWGHQLRIPHADGRFSYLNVDPYDGSVTIDRCN